MPEDSEEKANLLRALACKGPSYSGFLVHPGVLGLNLEYQKRRGEAADIYRDACHMLESLGRLHSHDGAALLTCLAQQLVDEDPQKALQYHGSVDVRQTACLEAISARMEHQGRDTDLQHPRCF